MIQDVLLVADTVPTLGALGVLAAVLVVSGWALGRGHLVTSGHLKAVEDARIREERAHAHTRKQLESSREELSANTRQVERLADSTASISGALSALHAILVHNQGTFHVNPKQNEDD